MGSWQAGENLQLCLVHRPPLVCAALALLLLGASGLGLGGFILNHGDGLRNPDIPQDWVSFMRSLGQLTLCPWNRTAAEKLSGPESRTVKLLTSLNLGEVIKNRTQQLGATVRGHQLGLSGSSAEEPVLITALVPVEKTSGICLVFSAAPKILPSSQPPTSCLEEEEADIVNTYASSKPEEECYEVWSHEGLILTKLLTMEERVLCGSRLLYFSCFLLFFCGFLCCFAAVCTHPRWDTPWQRPHI
ncbi:insulin-like growth factor-binding protein 3 receptor [Phascolarctos cinereus]|uniref:Insulin-like growth factor-binding protein 3 receptor n=1 Tax=Phascolarctos cinereus TaxID=38626 RepID=A0A6P5LYG8_PHACI|nr:insulin-like growth factor-binding protein 3 receptor [Phascolarctos cinereus]XP_020862343.1 insulin-like growth factor-binding protein 3 receptor [Phascolarctos cinereus]XP_020862344.1 insulin-like growth factor-binding protein 3 receptor [Phascolarctos cinereus]XP_020862345.1 insulin-like growth factor-binding protein 3 receptor [Phascolarctos cinereus]XP_020862346.1 insulin-like growth factor-binding protein 3 receptor [Phascolarctos cinereus]